MKQNRLAERLGIEVPLIQAPMAAVSTPEMAAAVSNAGGLGMLVSAMMTPDQFGAVWRGSPGNQQAVWREFLRS